MMPLNYYQVDSCYYEFTVSYYVECRENEAKYSNNPKNIEVKQKKSGILQTLVLTVKSGVFWEQFTTHYNSLP